MTRSISSNILRFVFFLLLQWLLFNYMDLFKGMAYPLPYIFAMLMLPFETPKWLYLCLGFIYGLLLDVTIDTLGMHTSACVFLGLLIPLVVRIIPVRENFGITDSPTMASRGLRWYLIYALILTFAHHTWLFFIEWFKFSSVGWLILKIILSTLYTTMFLILFQFIFYSKNKMTN